MGFAPAHGGPGGGVARARCAGPGGRSPGRAQAEGGGAVSLESGAPSGRGRDAGCCGSGGRAGGDVTGSPSRHLRSLGLWVTGRPAAGPRRRRQRDLPTVRVGVGRGPESGRGGRPRLSRAGGAAGLGPRHLG